MEVLKVVQNRAAWWLLWDPLELEVSSRNLSIEQGVDLINLLNLSTVFWLHYEQSQLFFMLSLVE